MSDAAFDRLCEAYGLQLTYTSATGLPVHPSREVREKVLRAMGIAAETEADVAASLAEASKTVSAKEAEAKCFLPSWLEGGRAWGVTCQLYGVRSGRNHGIGDLEDLARLAERTAADGADFVGVNPLHALFSADPGRCSPFSPSNRVYLNPLYIALDRLPGTDIEPDLDRHVVDQLRAAEWIDYEAVARLKLSALREVWRSLDTQPSRWVDDGRERFARFVESGGEGLYRHAVFEVLSEHFGQTHGAGWRSWPDPFQKPDSPEVAAFAEAHAEAVDFQLWLQWVADTQLAEAARRARAAGMRIGLYLDVAVGTAPDGSATWSDPDLVVAGANVGAPPDAFFLGGQNWGLAPFSPAGLQKRAFEPLRHMLDAVGRHAGAIRIDHAMSLERLFWIPDGTDPADGCYVRYPLSEMIRTLAAASNEHETIVIGEDLGTVPEGFDAIMHDARLLSYRVLYFEFVRGQFRAARSYRKNAFVTVSTHDLPPFAGWWAGDDVELFRELGLLDTAEAEQRAGERANDRTGLMRRLSRDLPKRYAIDAAGSGGDGEAPLVSVHAFLARTPSWLMGVQVEDLCGARRPVNVPGTWREYPNWCLRMPTPVEEAAESSSWIDTMAAVARERPRQA